MYELTSDLFTLGLVACGSMLSFGAASDGPKPSEAIVVQARALQEEALSEWRGLRDISVRSRSVVPVIKDAVSLQTRFC